MVTIILIIYGHLHRFTNNYSPSNKTTNQTLENQSKYQLAQFTAVTNLPSQQHRSYENVILNQVSPTTLTNPLLVCLLTF